MRLGIAILALIATALVLVPALRTTDGAAATATAQLANPAVDRNQVTAAVKRLTNLARRIDRIEAKYTTWGEYRQRSGVTGDVDGFSSATPVWVVAVSGDVAGQFGFGQAYTWGVYVFDARTGQPVHTAAHDDAPWPRYFDVLADRSR